jgi:hypothetical protein
MSRVGVLVDATGQGQVVLAPGQLIPVSGDYYVVSGASPTGPASGDLSGNYPGPTVASVGGSSAATVAGQRAAHEAAYTHANIPTTDEKAALPGTSGTPSITNKYVTDADARNTNARAPTGSATGDLTGSYPGPVLVALGLASGPLGTASRTPSVTIDTKGRVTALTDQAILIAESQVTNLVSDLAALALAKQDFTNSFLTMGG